MGLVSYRIVSDNYIRTVVSGSRDNKLPVGDILTELFPLSHTLVHGDAEGVDTLAGLWAAEHGLDVVACPAGDVHPLERNRRMVEHPQTAGVIALYSGNGERYSIGAFKGGTLYTAKYAIRLGRAVDIVVRTPEVATQLCKHADYVRANIYVWEDE